MKNLKSKLKKLILRLSKVRYFNRWIIFLVDLCLATLATIMVILSMENNLRYSVSMEYGIYAAAMGGGSVNPFTGAFNFSVREGYIVRNGKICEPVRGASLIGTGSEILMNIDMVGQNLDTAQGMCGSASGSVPTDVGQPLIRVSEITVGGQA